MKWLLRILILNDLFNDGSDYFLKTYLSRYNTQKLERFVKKLKNSYGNNTEIKIINYHKCGIKNIDATSLFSDLRHELPIEEYDSIVKKIKAKTKSINENFLSNSKRLNFLNYGGINLGDLLEINLIRFFNSYLGEFELLKTVIKKESFDKVILYNCNPFFVDFTIGLLKPGSNIYKFNDKLYYFSGKVFRRIPFIKWLFLKIILPILKSKKDMKLSKTKPNVVFVANTKNQKNSIQPVYEELIKDVNINSIIYSQNHYLRIADLGLYFKFINHIVENWKTHINQICKNFETYEFIMKFFLEKQLYKLFTMFFNECIHLRRVFNIQKPSLVTISNDKRIECKLMARICKLNEIPTIYIPHAGIPIEGETLSNNDFSYLALWGEYDLKYFHNIGLKESKLIVTGNPGFESIYTQKLKKLIEIEDIFSNRVYKFNTHKMTILLATTPYDSASIEKLIKSVVESLKQLNLIENLVIKLHPREDGMFHKKILKELGVNPIIVRDYSVLELINSSDILISARSGIILEAMIIGTPVILAEFLKFGFLYIQPYAFNSKKFIKVAENQKSLIEILERFKNDKELLLNYSREIKRNSKLFSYYNENNPPTKNVVNLIQKAMK